MLKTFWAKENQSATQGKINSCKVSMDLLKGFLTKISLKLTKYQRIFPLAKRKQAKL